MGGKDAVQPRYIHTKLCDSTKKIYNKLDDPLYEYNDDDGVKVEPKILYTSITSNVIGKWYKVL